MNADQQAGQPPQPASPRGDRPSGSITGEWQAASHLYRYVPHPHISRRKREGPVKVADQMDRSTPLARLNSRLALLITVAVGSIWAAYLFTILAFVSFPSAIASGNTIIIVAWIAQTFLQLVLLPVIIVGQNIQGAASDKRAEQTYHDAEAVLHEALQIEQHLCVQDNELHQQAQRLQEIITTLQKAYPAIVDGGAPAATGD